jgi:hypothetical protein
MGRLNLTLDDDTHSRLAKHAKREGTPQATLARELLNQALEAREAQERRKRLARDYAAGRKDAGALLRDLEAGQLELLDET